MKRYILTSPTLFRRLAWKPLNLQHRQHTRCFSIRHRQLRTMSRHPDFKTVEATREDWETIEWHLNKTVNPEWKVGTGATDDSWKSLKKVEIDPYAEGRRVGDNYKLMISAITPRFIGFVSTISKDGKTTNLAPFSYTTMVAHDPPMVVIGFSSSMESKKDTLQNILDTGELVINVISEWFLEAANYTSINAPPGVSEFDLSGLTPAPSSKVKPPHVAESAFSIEAKLVSHHPWVSPATGKTTGVTIFAQGLNFHVREDMWAEGNEGSIVDIGKLKPISRLGGIMYGRTTAGAELPRPDFAKEAEKEDVKALL
ncbi:hypothetical protein TWF225_004070 [Orbilia oligospora]|uniref:Uncharacterized protein n=1 Tax=Orbilia oligospora TaxID=2813651 RepID=A0A7C8PNQ6_ORBOL|nr:hypothetical protein TWF751_004809 [Orbilia oligospora]KAF3187848.1 hypothetical protein TWF225_004070 [Orbilia oligospora]KAF3248122.1 hypothetical protein TWF128_008479 [Orbilia oligospora]KAF3248123.1 hypothetical protein TWF128_008479 [Orbilia oligospora]KAF3256125.1 hypothetical protein TWF217_006385 [Orbilia oligospora]